MHKHPVRGQRQRLQTGKETRAARKSRKPFLQITPHTMYSFTLFVSPPPLVHQHNQQPSMACPQGLVTTGVHSAPQATGVPVQEPCHVPGCVHTPPCSLASGPSPLHTCHAHQRAPAPSLLLSPRPLQWSGHLTLFVLAVQLHTAALFIVYASLTEHSCRPGVCTAGLHTPDKPPASPPAADGHITSPTPVWYCPGSVLRSPVSTTAQSLTSQP